MNLLILPFDHRSSFSSKILKISGEPNEEQVQQIKDLKNTIFEAFLNIREKDENPEDLGILVDEEYGKEILKKANDRGITTSVGVEKSGQKVLKFEYGNKFNKHIEQINPNYVKVLIRYHPENQRGNKKQLSRLKKLSDYCKKTNRNLLLELLVPPSEKEKEEETFDTNIRPEKTAKAIKEIINKEIEVDIWKLEGFTYEGWEKVLQNLPENSKIVVLGRGEDEEKVEFWLKEAAKFDQIIGFAIGRTIFMKPLLSLLDEKISKEEAKRQIGLNYKKFIDIWREAKSKE